MKKWQGYSFKLQPDKLKDKQKINKISDAIIGQIYINFILFCTKIFFLIFWILSTKSIK